MIMAIVKCLDNNLETVAEHGGVQLQGIFGVMKATNPKGYKKEGDSYLLLGKPFIKIVPEKNDVINIPHLEEILNHFNLIK